MPIRRPQAAHDEAVEFKNGPAIAPAALVGLHGAQTAVLPKEQEDGGKTLATATQGKGIIDCFPDLQSREPGHRTAPREQCR
jgi:hypothetical protein